MTYTLKHKSSDNTRLCKFMKQCVQTANKKAEECNVCHKKLAMNCVAGKICLTHEQRAGTRLGGGTLV